MALLPVAIKAVVLVTVYVVAQPVSNVESIMIHLVIMYSNIELVNYQEKRLTTLHGGRFELLWGILKNFFAAALRVWLSCDLTPSQVHAIIHAY